MAQKEIALKTARLKTLDKETTKCKDETEFANYNLVENKQEMEGFRKQMEQSNIGAGVHKNELERSKMLQKEAYEKCAKFEKC